MKRLFLFVALVLTSGILFAQRETPVDWSFKAVKVDAAQYDLVFTAEIKSGWYIYSQHLEEGGPIPTAFYLDVADGFTPEGVTKEESEHKEEGHDDLFDMEVIKFKKKAVFTQRVKLSGKVQNISGYLEFMTCNGEQCMPPTSVDFNIDL